MGFVWFLLGLIVGGIIGLTIMCLFQINRLNDYELKLREIEEKAHHPHHQPLLRGYPKTDKQSANMQDTS